MDLLVKLDYINILKSIEELPFSVGKKLLTEFLQGKSEHESIRRNRLDKLVHFGSLGYDTEEINEMIEILVKTGMIKTTSVKSNAYWKVMELTDKGRIEIDNPTLDKKKDPFKIAHKKTIITEQEKRVFEVFGTELSRYDDQQKKAIISKSRKILCIAGAGSGKTTVLTKRIEFLIKYKSVDPNKILAITFTRKSRHEMQKRLGEGVVSIETFNSFCEKILLRYNDKIYPGKMSVVTYRDKRIMIAKALLGLHLDTSKANDIYFTPMQKRSKSDEQLRNIFLNDCFFVLDYFKFKNKKIEDAELTTIEPDSRRGAELLHKVCGYIDQYMKKNNLRDFADQILDAIRLFETHPELIPQYDHILIDEYQDVNSTQVRMTDILKPDNIFAVGDPRQSIYGWRGSDMKYTLMFESKYPDCEVIMLTNNYRSDKHIVELINNSIKNMGLPDLECTKDYRKDIHLLKFENEDSEREFVMQKILASEVPRHETFVLARTNRQLNELSEVFASRGIAHIVRSEELMTKTMTNAEADMVTLATIHAIKGLEAEMVMVIGCTPINFPCKGSEHPALEMIKIDEYDKEEEERRLFYVAMSRAKKSLYLTYTGSKPTFFINSSMMKTLDAKQICNLISDTDNRMHNTRQGDTPEKRLRDWRKETSASMGIPAYMIMNDRTLIELVQKMPCSTEELEEIYGLGATKIRKYGDEIIKIISG